MRLPYFQEEWTAGWIESPDNEYGVSPLFRNEFILKEKAVGARAYVCGLGFYCFYINGKRVGDRVLEPGWTNYNKRVLYSVYDVGSFLREGKNVIGIELGEGWYGHRHDSL